ncbi:MAG: lysophospholipid acyltransferase family protein [Nitrospinae bacterium]|nr:lysophospholipid acyltransferase family protein [Nitrospinota bacterium]
MKDLLFKKFLPWIAFLFIYLLCSTLRVKVAGRESEKELEEKKRPVIYVFWHGRMLFFPYFYRFLGRHTILVSPSKDGEIVARTSRLFGFSTVRGSGYKEGARALRRLIRILKKGGSIGIIGDGSRGPVFQAQKGIVRLAALSGATLLPITYGTPAKFVFRSWDRFILPYPFAKVKVVYGCPVVVPRKITANEEEEMRVELEKRLNRITFEADED